MPQNDYNQLIEKFQQFLSKAIQLLRLLTLLAYAQLWAARKLAVHLPRPWERYLTRNLNPTITPSMVQRSFLRIITQIGTPAISPKPRGFSTGRVPGQSLGKRQRQSVLKKGRKSQSSPQKTA